ncbi:MAG: signal peptidase I [Candidatus Woesearchaeota archaeon]
MARQKRKIKNQSPHHSQNNHQSNTYQKGKEYAKKTWHFIWHSDSILSWIVNIVLAYVIIRFLFYPGLGMLFGTSFPMVAVISGSMEHRITAQDSYHMPTLCGITFENAQRSISPNLYWEHCGSFYEEYNITQDKFSSFLFPRGFNKGDIIIIYGQDTKYLKIGDVIVFRSNVRAEPIIHRIIQIDEVNGEFVFTTKGDHNQALGPMDINIQESAVLGKGVFRIPYLGWVKIWFTDLVNLVAGNR